MRFRCVKVIFHVGMVLACWMLQSLIYNPGNPNLASASMKNAVIFIRHQRIVCRNGHLMVYPNATLGISTSVLIGEKLMSPSMKVRPMRMKKPDWRW